MSNIMLRASVQPVGSFRKLRLELDGGVLICRMKDWVRRQAVFVPVEGMSLRAGARRDGRQLIQGLAAPLLFLMLVGALHGAAARVLGFSGAVPAPLANGLFWAFLLSGLGLCLGYTTVKALRFLRKAPTVRIEIDEEDAYGVLEFWHEPGRDAGLDRMVKRLYEVERRQPEEAPYPLRQGYAWQHVRPLRAVLLRSAAGAALALAVTIVVVQALGLYAGRDIVVEPVYYLVLLLPALWFLGGYALEMVRVQFEPASFREGLRCYYREAFEGAERAFRRTLDAAPDHLPSLYFLTQIYANRFDFDNAFKHCHRLEREAPDIGEDLHQALWRLKRLAARLNQSEV